MNFLEERILRDGVIRSRGYKPESLAIVNAMDAQAGKVVFR